MIYIQMRFRYTVSTFIERARAIHGAAYDYTAVQDVTGAFSRVPIRCVACGRTWQCMLHNHIHKRLGCVCQNTSHGETAVIAALKSHDITFTREFRLDSNKRREYDFMFTHRGTSYILEYDGIQHFREIPFFHGKTRFPQRQLVDVEKTLAAVQAGYSVIRIDYTEYQRVREHIMRALNISTRTYFSTPALYAFITCHITPCPI